MISYSQNFEDVILNRVFDGRARGFYIDLGAMDPVYDSVTKAFYDRGWFGINIEPNGYFHAKLVDSRPRDLNLNVAVGDKEETRSFYVFEKEGISTFSEDFRNRSLERGYSCKDAPCRVTTLASICEEHVKCPIDFLKIDAEGWEGPILHGANWNLFRPTVLVLEAIEPFLHAPSWESWEPFLLTQCGYTFAYFDGLNRFYLAQESEELTRHFARPPGILDGFQMHATVEAERRASEAQAEILQLKAALAEAERNASAARGEAQEAPMAGEMLRVKFESERRRADDLEKQLLECRLWVGRLSETLSAMRRLHRIV